MSDLLEQMTLRDRGGAARAGQGGDVEKLCRVSVHKLIGETVVTLQLRGTLHVGVTQRGSLYLSDFEIRSVRSENGALILFLISN